MRKLPWLAVCLAACALAAGVSDKTVSWALGLRQQGQDSKDLHTFSGAASRQTYSQYDVCLYVPPRGADGDGKGWMVRAPLLAAARHVLRASPARSLPCAPRATLPAEPGRSSPALAGMGCAAPQPERARGQRRAC